MKREAGSTSPLSPPQAGTAVSQPLREPALRGGKAPGGEGEPALRHAVAIEPAKPLLRGVAHQHAIAAALAGGVMLVAAAHTARAKLACLVFAASLVCLFSASATYHRGTWTAPWLAALRRLDHAAIFILIAGTYTPMCLLGLDEATGRKLLSIVWAGATVGFLQVAFWVSAPKWLTTLTYIALGWTVLPYRREIAAGLGQPGVSLLVAGGVVYSLGGLIYAARWPGKRARVFGYHEYFHSLTLVAAGLHFAAVYLLVNRL